MFCQTMQRTEAIDILDFCILILTVVRVQSYFILQNQLEFWNVLINNADRSFSFRFEVMMCCFVT